jgi:ankyrin repeat protein
MTTLRILPNHRLYIYIYFIVIIFLPRGLLEQTKTLLQRQAKIVTTVTKETPLHWAVRGGHHEIVELLLTRHQELSVYALNDRMESPMEIARTLGFGTIVQLLWEHAEAHGQVPPTLNTVLNESQIHDTGIRTMSMKPKGGVRKLTIKRGGGDQ